MQFDFFCFVALRVTSLLTMKSRVLEYSYDDGEMWVDLYHSRSHRYTPPLAMAPPSVEQRARFGLFIG